MVPLVDLGAGLVPRSDLTIPDDFGRSRGEGNQGKNNLWSELKGWRRDKIREGR